MKNSGAFWIFCDGGLGQRAAGGRLVRDPTPPSSYPTGSRTNSDPSPSQTRGIRSCWGGSRHQYFVSFPGESQLQQVSTTAWDGSVGGEELSFEGRGGGYLSPSPALISTQGTSSTFSVTPTRTGRCYKFKREEKKMENCD